MLVLGCEDVGPIYGPYAPWAQTVLDDLRKETDINSEGKEIQRSWFPEAKRGLDLFKTVILSKKDKNILLQEEHIIC